MDISSVSRLISGFNATQNTQENSAIPGMPATSAANSGTDFGAATTYNPGEQPATAETFSTDKERVNKMWERHNERVESFRQMVETLLGQQAERQGLAEGWSIKDLKDVEITPEMRAEAQAMVDEGGYYSVDETASRILDFAVALTGGDPSKIESMRGAVQKAFDQTERLFKGKLPEITKQTHEAVMKGFDEWAQAADAAAISLLNKDK